MRKITSILLCIAMMLGLGSVASAVEACDINSVIDSFEWDDEYKDILKSKVKKLKWYER